MLENVVFLELRRKYRDIFYFQEKHECDFLVKEKNRIVAAIQVCLELNEETRGRELNGLIAALEQFRLKKGLILTHNQEDEFTIKGMRIIVKPVWKWLVNP